MTDLCDLSAVELRRLIGAKQASPRELLASCRRRIEAVNGTVNAVVAFDEAGAEEAAAAAEQAVMRGDPLGPLHGLPLGIKDLNETAGLRTTHGSLVFQDSVPKADESVVARQRAAGGLIVAKTNTPEFGAGANTTNKVYGATGNPFDPAKTCAGSSGGSAVTLATAMLPLCNGSDLGGSLRTPASFCGVVGLRPTPGRVPSHEAGNVFSSLSVEGPMGRSVADVALLLSVLAGHDPLDPKSRPGDARALARPAPVDPATLTVAISEDLGVAPIAEEIRRVFRDRVGRFRHLFREARESDPPLQKATPIFETLRAAGFVAAFKDLLAHKRELLGPNVIANTEAGLKLSGADVAAAGVAHTQLQQGFVRFMDDHDLLICPGASVSPFDKTQLFPSEIDGKPLQTYISWICITYGITLTGHPVLVLPCGLDEQGMPFGLQLVGKPWQEERLLGIGLALEAELARIPECRRPLPDLERLSA